MGWMYSLDFGVPIQGFKYERNLGDSCRRYTKIECEIFFYFILFFFAINQCFPTFIYIYIYIFISRIQVTCWLR